MTGRTLAKWRIGEATFAGSALTALSLAVVVGAVRQWSLLVVVPLTLWAAYHAGCFVEHALRFLRPDALDDATNNQGGQG